MIKLGLLTACLPQAPLLEIAAWAAPAGFQALEVAAWPPDSDLPGAASHIDVRELSKDRADELRGELAEQGLEVSLLAFYENNLHPDAERRREIVGHLQLCIDAAALLGCPAVGTFIGRDPSASVAENLRAAERVFPALVEHAGARGVKVAIENCVMEGWHPDGYPGNVAYSPELWEWMFDLGLYLNFDPSHLLWLGIDPVAAVRPYIDRVVHAHAKDTELWPERRNRFGFFGPAVDRADPWDGGWWCYRLPGRGELDWHAFVQALGEGGFDGVLSIEHEDPDWEGSPERVREGLEIARETLAPLL